MTIEDEVNEEFDKMWQKDNQGLNFPENGTDLKAWCKYHYLAGRAILASEKERGMSEQPTHPDINVLLKHMEKEICYEHYHYNQHGSGCHYFKSVCPYCQLSATKEELEEAKYQSDQNFDLKQEYRTAILSLGIDFFRDDEGVLLDPVEMGGRLRGLFGKLSKERDELREVLATTTDKYGKLSLRADAVQKQHDEWCDIAESLRTECERLKENIEHSIDLDQERVNLEIEIHDLKKELAALRRQIENCSDCTHDLKLAREALGMGGK